MMYMEKLTLNLMVVHNIFLHSSMKLQNMCGNSYFFKSKDEVFSKFLEWKSMVEKSIGIQVKRFRTDNGREFIFNEYERYLKKEGIIHETTVPYTPEQNGKAERFNRTVVEMTRAMLEDSGLPRKFWAEAMSTGVYLRNRTIVKGMNSTPFEALHGIKPDVSHLRIFGCNGYERKKLRL